MVVLLPGASVLLTHLLFRACTSWLSLALFQCGVHGRLHPSFKVLKYTWLRCGWKLPVVMGSLAAGLPILCLVHVGALRISTWLLCAFKLPLFFGAPFASKRDLYYANFEHYNKYHSIWQHRTLSLEYHWEWTLSATPEKPWCGPPELLVFVLHNTFVAFALVYITPFLLVTAKWSYLVCVFCLVCFLYIILHVSKIITVLVFCWFISLNTILFKFIHER